jgi:putative sigma-54 modulation protein
MRPALTGRHVEISPALRRLADRKLGKLDRVLNNAVVSSQVVLTLEKYLRVVDVTVHARGDHILHGIGRTNAWETSFAAAVEKITQQALKVKGRWHERKRRAVPARAVPPPVEEPVAEEPGPPPPRILRATRYAVRPMTVEEAAMAVDDGKDAFLVFRNARTEAVNVLYRRKDGHLGLIEPEA